MCSSRTRSTRGVRQRRGDCPRSSATTMKDGSRSEEHTSELQSQSNLVCRLLLEKKNGACAWFARCRSSYSSLARSCRSRQLSLAALFYYFDPRSTNELPPECSNHTVARI